MPTYNRAKSIERAVNSVLNQTYRNFELILVDDGSTDRTVEILNHLTDPRIRILRHETNKGVTAAKNTGLKAIRGEWFTTFDSDDEMVPEALETMIRIPLYFDKNITAVTCNCLDASDHSLRGKGLTEDQYLTVEAMMAGGLFKDFDFWGITKTSLLMGDHFNENLKGVEDVLWYKIDDRALRYYIHKPLSIVYTEGNDRISVSRYNFKKDLNLYTHLIEEDYYLNKLKKYNPVKLHQICRNGIIVAKISGQDSLATRYYEYLKEGPKNLVDRMVYNFRFASVLMKYYKTAKSIIK
ncbi:MAG: glycosyltransferase, partial [Bacteroidota bacterium]|nr:glycosyltransferase [Bacteroidota bacterium]